MNFGALDIKYCSLVYDTNSYGTEKGISYYVILLTVTFDSEFVMKPASVEMAQRLTRTPH